MTKIKILHTADWHLGKRLDRFSRFDEQVLAMTKICQIADHHKVDLVLIAGDVFDHFNPDTASTELFYQTVKKLTNNGLRPVVAIAGNHDSGERLSAPDPLARANGIILIGQPFEEIRPFELETGVKMECPEAGIIRLYIPKTPDTPINIIATPYTNEFRLRQALLSEDKEEELRQILSAKWAGLAERHFSNDGCNLLMTHLFVVKKGEPLPEEPSDEKPILHIGGTQAIYTNCFPDGLDYVALGHLHGYRNVGGKDCPIIYASSPLQYSFGESGMTGQVAIVEYQIEGSAEVQPVALEVGKTLLRFQANGLDEAIKWLTNNQGSLVELTIKSDDYLTAQDRQVLHSTHDGIVHIIPQVTGSGENQQETVNLKLDRTALFYQYFESKHSQPPGDDMKDLFKEVINKSGQ